MKALTAPDQTVYDAVNQIRDRKNVKMPPLPTGLSKEEMRQRIRHERRVELAFETHRFCGYAQMAQVGTQEGLNAYGMKVTKSGTVYTYENSPVREPSLPGRPFDLFPIPQAERERTRR